MAAQNCNFRFNPQKSAIENFFALIYRNNRIRLTSRDVELAEPEVLDGDPDGDNTKIHIKSLPGSPFSGEDDLFYARADLDTYYPDFTVDLAELTSLNDKAALMQYIDGNFDLIDGEFELDLEDPIGSLIAYTHIDVIAKDKSIIYIGKKTINILWSAAMRRADEEGRIRVTDEGQFRVIDE